MTKYYPLAELLIADSKFLGFCFHVTSTEEALKYQRELKVQYPDAAHVAAIYPDGFDGDGEPPGSVGPAILPLLPDGLAIVVVRYFENRLLGMSCGRLPYCYQAIARLCLHRSQYRKEPMICDHPYPRKNVYGMGSGDCELILNVIEDPEGTILEQVQNELDFGGFRGATGEVLPRLQNLQADRTQNSIPVYRYPGNYTGQEWETFDWAPTSLKIKTAVEAALLPLFDQTMNHCVTNYYRDGKDFIAHHSDKDLDLDRDGVIVSVSLGDERVLELRRRHEPKDTMRIVLPHGSMLVLGPNTNRNYSHSILSKEGSTKPRISLTLREVKTFLDLTTGRLFGQGATAKSITEVRRRRFLEDIGWVGGGLMMTSWFLGTNKKSEPKSKFSLPVVVPIALFAIGTYSLRLFNDRRYMKDEERSAREFFSKTSMSGTKY